MSLPTSPLRLLPTAATFVGWDFHPLEFRAFSRRTELIRLGVCAAGVFTKGEMCVCWVRCYVGSGMMSFGRGHRGSQAC